MDAAPLRDADLHGWQYFRRLAPLLRRLRAAGCDRDRADNRSLHFDQYCGLILLALFSPLARSLRALSQASGLAAVQQRLGIRRASLGSLSEAAGVFDPDLLLPIIGELVGDLRPIAADPRLKDVRPLLTAVDSTLVKTLPRLAEAMWSRSKDGSTQHYWRLHTHFAVDRRAPVRIDATAPTAGGQTDERAVLRRRLEPDHCYVMDRGYAQFTLFNDIADAGSSYVCRIRDNSSFAAAEGRPLSAAARADGVTRDAVVRLGLGSKRSVRPHHPVRLVEVVAAPHAKRGGRKGKTAGPPSGESLLIATNLLDVPAEVVALIYRQRWLIEVFFRFFKHVLGCRHLLSAQPGGIAVQAYCALIACLLIARWTGRKPTQRTYEMLCWYLLGWATEDELLAHLEKLKTHVTG